MNDETDQLELTWYTKFACLDASGEKPGDGGKGGDKPKDGDKEGDKPKDGNKGGHGEEDINKSWGFFTWLVVLYAYPISSLPSLFCLTETNERKASF